jgi:hypothetical protein
VPDPAKEVKTNPVSIEGLEEVFDLSGTDGTESGTTDQTSNTAASHNPGQPGHETVEASDVATYISTADAAKLARVDSRTVRRWYEQKKIRGQFSNRKLLVVQEDLLPAAAEPDLYSEGTEPGTPEGTPGTPETKDSGHPGQSADMPQKSAVAFSDFLDRIERLSKENGELRTLLDEQRRENQELRLLTDSQQKRGWWTRFTSWFIGRS